MERRDAEAHWTVNRGDGWLRGYHESVSAPTRQAVLDALLRYAPFACVLDLGCNCGVLTPLVLAASPGAHVTGIDINVEAVAAAKRLYPAQTWICASIVDWLPLLAGHAKADVVVSSSCLAHVRPADLPDVLGAIAQIAQRAIVLQESTVTPLYGEGQTECGVLEWRHDYARHLQGMGWTRVSRVWQEVTTTRPAAVQAFEPHGDAVSR